MRLQIQKILAVVFRISSTKGAVKMFFIISSNPLSSCATLSEAEGESKDLRTKLVPRSHHAASPWSG